MPSCQVQYSQVIVYLLCFHERKKERKKERKGSDICSTVTEGQLQSIPTTHGDRILRNEHHQLICQYLSQNFATPMNEHIWIVDNTPMHTASFKVSLYKTRVQRAGLTASHWNTSRSLACRRAKRERKKKLVIRRDPRAATCSHELSISQPHSDLAPICCGQPLDFCPALSEVFQF